MTEDTSRTLHPGDIVHVLKTGLIVHSGTPMGGTIVVRGQVLSLTTDMLRVAVDREGNPSGIALAADPEAQLARWGELRFAMGRPGPDFVPTVPGDPEHAEARESARRAAWAEPDPQRRAEALKAVERRYGAAGTTSRTFAAPRSNYWDEKAEEQARKREASGVVHRNASWTVSGEGA